MFGSNAESPLCRIGAATSADEVLSSQPLIVAQSAAAGRGVTMSLELDALTLAIAPAPAGIGVARSSWEVGVGVDSSLLRVAVGEALAAAHEPPSSLVTLRRTRPTCVDMVIEAARACAWAE
jgi:hypothetical protein